MKNLNNRGSILQIVLVIFLVIIFVITTCLMTMQFNVSNYKLVDLMMKQKNLEINLIAYYVDQMENDILLSDDYEESGYHIYNQIDDLGTVYDITTYVESKEMNYSFFVQISMENFRVLKFEYREVTMFYFIMALLIISFILTYLRQKRYQDNRDMQFKLRMASFILLLLVAYFTFFVA